MSDQPQRKIDLKGQGFADRFKATPLAVVGMHISFFSHSLTLTSLGAHLEVFEATGNFLNEDPQNHYLVDPETPGG
jgi:hypothetical protein